jgi:uncharacterized alkaline shock family protein YloU
MGEATISADVLASYAADAAREVHGVRGLAESHVPGRRGGVRIQPGEGGVRIELRLEVDWGAAIPEVGRGVQAQVRAYLERMADVELAGVDVVVDEVGPAA